MTEIETILTRIRNYLSHGEIGPCVKALLEDCEATIKQLVEQLEKQTETRHAAVT